MKIYFKPKYSVYQEKVVKCTLDCILDVCAQNDLGSRTIEYLFFVDKTLESTFSVSAVAKCSPEDKFCLETGKRIAESRASIKALRIAKHKIKKIKKALEGSTFRAEEVYTKISNMLVREQNHLSTLL